MNFRNTVAISTCAASGMGLLFAENFAALGGNVVLCDVNEQVLTEKVAEINAQNSGRAIGVVCDVRTRVRRICYQGTTSIARYQNHKRHTLVKEAI